MAVGHPSINQCSHIRLRPICHPGVCQPRGRDGEGEERRRWEVPESEAPTRQVGISQKISPRSSGAFCESVLHLAGSGAKSINIFRGGGSLRSPRIRSSSPPLTHKQMRHLSTRRKGTTAVSVTNVVRHWNCFRGSEPVYVVAVNVQAHVRERKTFSARVAVGF